MASFPLVSSTNDTSIGLLCCLAIKWYMNADFLGFFSPSQVLVEYSRIFAVKFWRHEFRRKTWSSFNGGKLTELEPTLQRAVFCANWPSNHWNEPTRFIQIKWTNKFISNMSSFPSIFGRNSETRRQWNAPSDWASSAPATAVTIYPTFYSSSHDLQSSRSTLSINMKSPTEFHLFVGREWDDRRLRLWPPSERGQRRHFWDSLALREETTFSLIGWIFNHSTGPCDTHTWTYKAKIIDNQTIASINRTFRQSKSPEMSTIRNGFWYRKMIIIYHYL